MRAALHCGAANAGDMDRFRSPPWYKYNVKLDFLAITKAGSRLVWIVLDDPKLMYKDIFHRVISGDEPITVLNIEPLHSSSHVEVQVHRLVRHGEIQGCGLPLTQSAVCPRPTLGANVTGRKFLAEMLD